ncbi:MAG: hypothetical protein PHS57_03600 [Alphaproteobacteria bacterium]|nr:hypothetical protein [Alphaproteobacteria bacterium]
MKKFVIFAITFVIIGSVALTPLYAKEGQSVKDPLQRLVRYSADDGSSSRNVIFDVATYQSLPRYIKKQAQLIAACAGGEKYAKTIKYYSYFSDYNRKKGLQPNYILDPSALKKADFSNCNMGNLCQNSQCALMGYSAIEPNRWTQSFVTPMYKWSVEYAPQKNESDPLVLWINLLSVQDSSCAASGGSATEEGCFRRYTWRRDGLAQVDVALTDEMKE